MPEENANAKNNSLNILFYVSLGFFILGIILVIIAIPLYEYYGPESYVWALEGIGGFFIVFTAIALILLSLNW